MPLTLSFITLCFTIMAIFWIISAFKTKRTIKKTGGWTMRILAIIIVISIISIQKNGQAYLPFLSIPTWPQTLGVQLLADFVTLLGLIVMIWARQTLGANWSANIVLKENHELITSGPYAYVRHPIYSGLLLMILGLVIFYANWAGIFLFLLFFIGAYIKGRKEEKILSEHFRDEYPAYRARVKALIPFVW